MKPPRDVWSPNSERGMTIVAARDGRNLISFPTAPGLDGLDRVRLVAGQIGPDRAGAYMWVAYPGGPAEEKS